MKDWLDRLREEMVQCDVPPRHSYSTRDIQKRFKFKSLSSASRWASKAVKAGKMKRVNVRMMNASRTGVNIVPYFVENPR